MFANCNTNGKLIFVALLALLIVASARSCVGVQLSSPPPDSTAPDSELVSYLASCMNVDPEFVGIDVLVSYRGALARLESGQIASKKACWLAPGEAGDLGWTFEEFNARSAVSNCFKAPTDIVASVTPEEAVPVIAQLIESSGCEVIFAISFEFIGALFHAVPTYPDVLFVAPVPVDELIAFPNFRGYAINGFEGSYLTGFVSQLHAPGDIIGGVWTQRIVTELQTAATAYFGIQDAAAASGQPAKQFELYYINSFDSVDKSVFSTRDLIEERGALHVITSVDRYEPQLEVRSRGLTSTGSIGNMGDYVGPSTLASLWLRWDVACVHTYAMALQHSGDAEVGWGETPYPLPCNSWTGAISPGTLSSAISDEHREMVLNAYRALRAHPFASFALWCGERVEPLLQDGEELDENGCMNFGQIFSIDRVHPEIVDLGDYEIELEEVTMNSGMKAGIYAACSIVAAACLFTGAIIILKRNRTAIHYASMPFCMIIVFGGLVSVSGAFLLAANDTKSLCQTWTAVIFMGFFVLASALLAKSWRLWYLMSSAEKLKRVNLDNKTLMIYCSVGLVLGLVMTMLWRFIEAPELRTKRSCDYSPSAEDIEFGVLQGDGDCLDDLEKYEYQEQCHFSTASYAVLVVMSVILYGAVLASLTFSRMTKNRFLNVLYEGNSIFMSAFSTAIVTLFVVMFIILAKDDYFALKTVICIGTCVIVFLFMAFLFFYRIYIVLAKKGDGSKHFENTNITRGMSSMGSSGARVSSKMSSVGLNGSSSSSLGGTPRSGAHTSIG
jgi:basic membrane lipoprotein Med (substrate-binding protein (PBP1-ABC) superfamily)